MSGIDLLSLLQRWPGRWRHAELWRIACGAAPPDGEVIARSVLESISRPLDPLEVFRRLLDDGAFSAAEALLEYPPFADAVDDTLIALGSELDLDNRRFQVRGQFLSALDVLLMRNQRAGSPIAADDPRLAEALEWSSHDKKRADRLLMEIENAVRDAEIERVALLRTRLEERLARAGGDVPASWRDAVERCLDQRQMDIAEALISGPFGDAADADGALPLPLENARFANISAAQLCRWILGREAATSGFFPRWDVLSIDAANRSLIETIERLAGAGTSVDDVARLAGELQTRLNVVAARAAVERFGDVYRTALRGLEDEACPVFAEGAVPFFVAGEGAIPDEATRGVPLAIVFHTGRELQAPVGYVRLTAWDIVRCLVRPDDFGFNLLRILASQVSRHRFIPQRDRSPNNWMARARSADARNVAERANRIPQLVSGAAGVGKTSLLMSFLDAFDGKGWTCRFISDASQLRLLGDPFNGGAAPGYALAIDNGHELTEETLDRLLQHAAAAGARLVVGGLPKLRRQAPRSLADDAYYRLSLASFSSLRRFAQRLFDLSGHRVSDVVLDRVAFCAAGRPALLYALVYALFLELAQRPVLSGAPILVDHVETAYCRNEFRSAAKSILIAPLETEPLANLVLATVLVIMELEIGRRGAPDVELERVLQWLETEDVRISAPELSDAVDYLRELELVHADSAKRCVTLSTTGGGYLVTSLLPNDRLQHFNSAKALVI
jgi:hypothetical protein